MRTGLERAAGGGHRGPQPEQARTASRGTGTVRCGPAVGEGDGRPRGPPLQRHHHGGARCVPRRVGQRLPDHAVQQPLGEPARFHGRVLSGGLPAHGEPRLRGAGDQLLQGLVGRGQRRRLVVVLAQDADDAVQPVRGVGGRRAQVGRRAPVLVAEAGGDLECARAQGDEAELVAEGVVHVLGDPGPFAQPGALLREALLVLQPGGAQPARLGQLAALPPVASAEPGEDAAEQQGARHDQPLGGRIDPDERDPRGAGAADGRETEHRGARPARPQPEQQREQAEGRAVGEGEQGPGGGQTESGRQPEGGERRAPGQGGRHRQHRHSGRLLPGRSGFVQPDPVGRERRQHEGRPEEGAPGVRGRARTFHAGDATSAGQGGTAVDRQVPVSLKGGGAPGTTVLRGTIERP